jgi:DNA replication protein DnaC
MSSTTTAQPPSNPGRIKPEPASSFLQVLCEDEIALRAATPLARRVRAARFEQTSTLEDFDFVYNSNITAALIRDLAA